jgi:hypothetical protein
MLVVIKTQQPRPVAVEKYQLRSETLMEPRSVLSAAISINGDGDLLRARTYLPAELLYTQLADDTDGLSCLLGSQQEDCPITFHGVLSLFAAGMPLFRGPQYHRYFRPCFTIHTYGSSNC